MVVDPDEPSTTTPPPPAGSAPDASASASMASAMRSLPVPDGFACSHLARIVQPQSFESEWSGSRGVDPMSCAWALSRQDGCAGASARRKRLRRSQRRRAYALTVAAAAMSRGCRKSGRSGRMSPPIGPRFLGKSPN